MSDDDLIRRLLGTDPWDSPSVAAEYLAEAAERIAALTAERDAAVKALSLTRRADDLREAYHRLPNDKNRIGDKKSKKSRARDDWLRAFRKAAKEARAALAALPAAPTFTAADLEKAWEMGRDAAATLCNVRGVGEQDGYGLTRAAQNYYRARDAIRSLTPPADLAQRVKGPAHD